MIKAEKRPKKGTLGNSSSRDQTEEECVLKRLFFFYSVDLTPLSKNQLILNGRVNFKIFNSTPLIYMSILMSVPHCLDYYSFVVNFEIRKCES